VRKPKKDREMLVLTFFHHGISTVYGPFETIELLHGFAAKEFGIVVSSIEIDKPYTHPVGGYTLQATIVKKPNEIRG